MSTEQQLRELFAADASAAPGPEGLKVGALGKVRRRRRRNLGFAVSGGLGLAVAAILVVPALTGGAPMGGWPTAESSVPPGMAGQPVPGGENGSCAYEYSPQAIAEHATFALDGTVAAIGRAQSTRPGFGQIDGLVGVTLAVHQWFRAGDQATVIVDMPAPAIATQGIERQGAPDYGIGTRLLVSGAARWGGDDPVAKAIAWWGCGGFTRYYSPDVAAAWDAAID